MHGRHAFSFAVAALAWTALCSPLAAQGQPLFREVPAQSVTRTYAEVAPLQQRNVRFDGAVLDGIDSAGIKPQDLEVELFQGRTLQLHYLASQSVGGSGNVHHYTVAGGDPYDYAAFSVVGEAMSGTIRVGHELYTVRHVGDGELTLSQVDELAMAPCGGALLPDPDFEGQQGTGNGPDGMASETIDLLIVYTSSTTSANGGHDGVFSLANLAVWETNYSYSNSDVDQRVNLVGCREVTGYVQSGSQNTDLSRLRATADGFMDEVHGWRDEYGADFVDLFISGYGSGIAYLMNPESAGFEDDAFSVCRDTRAASTYTLAHELGHNMGCHHDFANAGSTPLAAYAYGTRTATQSYRTVMAYSPGTRIQLFSNPDKFAPDGQVLGNAGTADNSRVLDETVDTTANFRAANETSHRVTTLFASNNGQSGNMFDILPATDLEISGIYINTSSTSTVSVDVWYRPGSYVGNENSSAGWTLLGNFSVTGQGTDVPTYVSFGGLPETIFEAGQSYGMYVDTNSTLRYTNGAIRTYSNNFLQITSGVGKAANFGSTFADRVWNGTISYNCAEGTDSLTTTFAGGNGFAGNMFNVQAKDDIRIHGFTTHIDGVGFLETLAVDVYMKNGSYVGFEDEAWAWTYVGTDYRSGGSLFGGSTHQIEVGGIDLQEGQNYAFYLHCATYNLGHTMQYTNGNNTYENTDLKITTGVGKGDAIFTGSTFTSRTWNGTIWYTVDRPRLSVANIIAGQQGVIRVENGTPFGRNYVSWSLSGGPISTQWGTVFLGSNYTTLPQINMNAAGEGQINAQVQPGTTGVTVYLQGLDVPSLQLTNPVSVTIQ